MVTTLSPFPKGLEQKLINKWKRENMPKVTFEFDYYDDMEELEMIRQAREMSCALLDIYSEVRNELKHGDEELSDHIHQLLEGIREITYKFT